MKIVGMSVDQFDGYHDVTIKFRLPFREQELSDADIHRLVSLAKELGGDDAGAAHDVGGEQVSGDTGGSRGRRGGSVAADPTPASTSPATAQAGSRRGRRTTQEQPELPMEDITTAAEPAQSPATAAPSGGRRRSTSPATSSAPETDTATSASPSSGGRRRGTQDPSSTPQSASSPAAGGRRSASPGTQASGGSAAGAGSTKIGDADLSKACSHAALVIGPEGVKAVLSEFGAKVSNQLDAHHRQEFLDKLAEVVGLREAAAEAPAGRRGRR